MKRYDILEIARESDKAILKELLEDQLFTEEIANYYDDTNKTQMESLSLLLAEAYRAGKKSE